MVMSVLMWSIIGNRYFCLPGQNLIDELETGATVINPFLIRHERKVKRLSYGSTTNLRFTPMIDELLNGFTRVRKRCLELKAKVHLS